MLLYAQLLGREFDALPIALKRIHERLGQRRYSGEVRVTRGPGVLASVFAAMTRLPPRYVGAIEVDIIADLHHEQWTRHFGEQAMRSRIYAHAGRLRERLGLVNFDFSLSIVDQCVNWRVAAVSVFGLPLPARWFCGVTATESVRDARYHFDVRVALVGVGLLVQYTGWLDTHGAEDEADAI